MIETTTPPFGTVSAVTHRGASLEVEGLRPLPDEDLEATR